ncbi:MAG: phenylalanine--tRNA ligase subunit alpha [bacterium]|nr:phenylalanine--tRNA ligase subunit alpha [bacterium]
MGIIKDDILNKYNNFISELRKEIEELERNPNQELKEKINSVKKKVELIKSEFLKGIVSQLLRELSKTDPSNKKEFGQEINRFKESIENDIKNITQKIEKKERELKYRYNLDLSIKFSSDTPGKLHILTIVQKNLMNVFAELGFEIIDGIEIEDEYHNFEALNIPADHPARDMWDTFYFRGGILRTHTSNMQIRILKTRRPPIKAISVGKCYRRDNMDATHSFQFHQLEGFSIDEKINFLDLVRTLYKFVHKYFGPNTKVNFVPSYFPFTEPSAEMSISCFHCSGQKDDCSVCKGSGWIEILGCGMINPIVLKNVDIDPEKFSGFAFGMGIERIAMLKYKIPDIRMFYQNYIEFNQLWR